MGEVRRRPQEEYQIRERTVIRSELSLKVAIGEELYWEGNPRADGSMPFHLDYESELKAIFEGDVPERSERHAL